MADQRLLDTTVKTPHDARTFFQRPDRLADPLYVITPIFNSVRYRTRWKLYQDFEARVARAGGILYTIEAAFGDRDFAVTDAGNPRHIQVRTKTEIWLKENMINLAVARLPLDWKYVAWIDADVGFARDDWANEAMHLLQHYHLIQMWSHAMELSPHHEPLAHWQSMVWCHQHGVDTAPGAGEYYGGGKKGRIYAHAGYAWAARRDAWDALGGLLDTCILGSADWHMAHALFDQAAMTLKRDFTWGYKKPVFEWQNRAHRSIRQNVGVMPGMLTHYWHGPKAKRRYKTRNDILVQDGFDPHLDLKRDWQGLYQLTGRSIRLRDDIRRYFSERDEDALPDEFTKPISGMASQ